MKKKVCGIILSLVMIISAVAVSLFACQKPAKHTANAAGFEESLTNVVDIISTSPPTYSGATVENVSPFYTPDSTDTGSSITPRADKYGQVSGVSFNVAPFKFNGTNSLYMWLYLFDTQTFELTVSIFDSSAKSCTWFFDASVVKSYGGGWSLLELKPDDCKESESGVVNLDNEYINISFKYESEYIHNVEQYLLETSERFSIYHVYLAGKTLSNTSSGQVDSVVKAFGKISSKFFPSSTAYKRDKILLKDPYSLFEYIMVGKTEYSKLANKTNYSWVITAYGPDGSEIDMDFGDTFTFYSMGCYTFNIELYEKQRFLNQQVEFIQVKILNESHKVFCEELSLGSFIVGMDYEIEEGGLLKIAFNMSRGITIVGDFDIKFTNDNVEIESQYTEGGVQYFLIRGLEAGKTKLKLAASARSENGTEIKTFTSEVNIKVLSSEDPEEQSITILWVVFGGFCVFFVGYLINSLVKARRNDVK